MSQMVVIGIILSSALLFPIIIGAIGYVVDYIYHRVFKN